MRDIKRPNRSERLSPWHWQHRCLTTVQGFGLGDQTDFRGTKPQPQYGGSGTLRPHWESRYTDLAISGTHPFKANNRHTSVSHNPARSIDPGQGLHRVNVVGHKWTAGPKQTEWNRVLGLRVGYMILQVSKERELIIFSSTGKTGHLKKRHGNTPPQHTVITTILVTLLL